MCVGVDGRTGSKLSGVQRVGTLHGDYDVTVCLPAVLGEMFFNAIGEQLADSLFVLLSACQPIVIRRAQQHRVMIGCQ